VTAPQAAPQASTTAQATSPGQGGAARIEEALAALAEVKDASPAEQVAPLTQAHRVLRETLDSIGDV
jgi:hypothetical protein